MSVNTAAIQQLYVAYFNRPADFSGLGYWEKAVADAKGSTAAVSAAFAASDEYKATFAGMDAAHVVAQIYQNLFNRAPELGGLNFWTQALLNKAVTIDNVVATIAGAAASDDKVTLNNKVAASIAFTNALDTSAEALAYAGDKANAIAKDWLSHIGSDASLGAAIDNAALSSTINSIVLNAPQNVGKTLALTVGIDTIDGTNANDTINAFASGVKADGSDGATVGANDTIDGGQGIDTLNLEVVGALNATQSGMVKNVEIINITGADLLGGGTIDASKYAGSTNINLMTAAGAVTVNNMGGKTLGINAGVAAAGGAAADVTANFGATATSAAVNLTNAQNQIWVGVTGAKVATLNVSGTVQDDGAGNAGTLSLSGASVSTLNLALASDAVVQTGLMAGLTTINSTGTGGVDLSDATAAVQTVTAANGDNTVNMQFVTAAATASAAAKNSSVVTGAGKDFISVGNTGTALASVDAGAGNDIINVVKTTGGGLNVQGGAGNDKIDITGVLESTDVIDGGAGTDTVKVAGSLTARIADDFIVLNKVIKNFEAIELKTAEGTVGAAGATEIALDASKLAGYKTFTFDGTGSFVKNVGADQALVMKAAALTASAAGYVANDTPNAVTTTYAGTLNVTDKVNASTLTARADTLNFNVAANTTHTGVATGVAATLNGDVKTAVVTLTNAQDTDATTGVVQHDNIASISITADKAGVSVAKGAIDSYTGLGGLTSLTLTGNGAATVINTAGKLATIDASGLGGTYTVTADGHISGAVTTGLNYTSTNASTVETIKLGAGIDTVNLNNSSFYGKMDTVSGLNLVTKADGSLDAANSDVLKVAAVTGAAKFITTQTDLDLALHDAAASSKGDTLVFNMGGDTYVYHDLGTPGSVDAADVVVKIVGGVNLDALIASLG